MNHKLALVLIGTLVISGCASNKPTVSLNNPTQVAQSVSIEEDKFEKTTTYSAVDIRKNNGIERLYLNAIKTQNPASVIYSVYIDDSYDAPWRHYDSAYDSNGKELVVIKIDHRTKFCIQDKCRLAEQLAVVVSRKYLEENSAKGISIKISGKRGEEIFALPGGYIEGFLRAVQ